MTTSQRPAALTIIAVLAIISGILYGVLGLIAMAGSSSASEVEGGAGAFFITGTLLAILGFLNLIFGFGAMALKPWAWKYGVGLQIFNIICGFFSLPGGIFVIAISGFVLWYVFRPNVKRIFGRA